MERASMDRIRLDLLQRRMPQVQRPLNGVKVFLTPYVHVSNFGPEPFEATWGRGTKAFFRFPLCVSRLQVDITLQHQHSCSGPQVSIG